MDITKHEAKYIVSLIEKRLEVLRNRILKINESNWYDFDEAQIHYKVCEISDEYCRLSDVVNTFYIASK